MRVAPSRRVSRRIDLSLHLSRTAMSLIGVALGLAFGSPALIAFAAAATFLAAFSFQHDLIHGSLPLPRRLRDPLLATIGSLMMMSGHSTKATHLHHHRRTFAADDLEGLSAHLPLWRALLISPLLTWRCRIEGWRRTTRLERRWQIAEMIANVAALFLFPWPMVAVNLVFQLAMPFWAGHVPHRAPHWLVTLARKLACTSSPTILSLAYHDLHHRHPGVPCQSLGVFADSPV